MTTIGVVSDTHSFPLPAQIFKDFEKVDFIIHAGDFCEVQDFKTFAKFKDLRAVLGNMDSAALRKQLPERLIITCEEIRIGVVHGSGAPQGILERIRSEFKNDQVDAIVFGHSHQPLIERAGRILFFNPGSPNDTVRAPYCSYGILKVTGKNIEAQIIRVKSWINYGLHGGPNTSSKSVKQKHASFAGF